MPDANSDFDKAPGRTTEAARRYASHIPGPMISAANVGVTKIPGNIAESEMITTPARPVVRFRVFFSSSVTFVIMVFGVELDISNPRFPTLKRPVFDFKQRYSLLCCI
jgi:hypothetical protein